LRAREILAKRVPVYMLILAVVLTAILIALITFYAQVPAVEETVKALRLKEVTVTIKDTDSDGNADEAIVGFSTDGAVDGEVAVTVILKDARGNRLDSSSEIVTVTAVKSYTIVPLRNVAAMDKVRSIEIKLEPVIVSRS
jgi:hypothetical protein